jgi:hypothetical protein
MKALKYNRVYINVLQSCSHHQIPPSAYQAVVLCLSLQKEGQKTKWVVDLVMKIDEEYKQELVSRRQAIVGAW